MLKIKDNSIENLSGYDVPQVSLKGRSKYTNRLNISVFDYKPPIKLDISYQAIDLYEKTFNEKLNIENGEYE